MRHQVQPRANPADHLLTRGDEFLTVSVLLDKQNPVLQSVTLQIFWQFLRPLQLLDDAGQMFVVALRDGQVLY